MVESIGSEAENWWRILAHVCRKWRHVIFGSPHRLDLRLVCSDRTPLRQMLDLWPPLPIILIHNFARSRSSGDNVIAALERNDRVCQITLKLDQQWEKVLDAMQEPFPALLHLSLSSDIEVAPLVPASFMGGSAPRLQYLRLERVSMPGLPKLLLSTTDLVRLNLLRIPHSGYISPEAIVTCLSTRCQGLKSFIWDSNRLNLARTDVCPHSHALFSPLSISYTSLGSANIWRTSWPGSILLYSTVWI